MTAGRPPSAREGNRTSGACGLDSPADACHARAMRVLKEEWKRLKQGKPGSRFRDLYEARRKQRRHPWSRVLFIATGVVLVAVGAVAGLIPGPGGVVFVTVGVALIARELETAARVLDWGEP